MWQTRLWTMWIGDSSVIARLTQNMRLSSAAKASERNPSSPLGELLPNTDHQLHSVTLQRGCDKNERLGSDPCSQTSKGKFGGAYQALLFKK